MATSGTYAFTLDLADMIEESFELAGLELRTGYDFRTARRSIDLLMLEWQNRGLNLWTIQEGTTSISQYAHLSNKLNQAKPLQYWLEKDPSAIAVNLWPVPDSAETYTLGYYYMQRVEDSGSPGSNNMDVPSRYLPCLVSGLAYQISLKRPEVSDRAPALKSAYEEQWNLAADADREKASFRVTPGGYRFP